MTKKNLKNKEEFSQEKNNMEIVPLSDLKQNKSLITQNELGDEAKKKRAVIIGTLNVFVQPFKDRHERHYKESTFHLAADIFLVAIVLILIGFIVWVLFFKSISSDVLLESSHKNDEIISGRTETFELKYDNKSEESISDVSISVSWGDNFILENTVPADIFNQSTNTFTLGDLSSGANGRIKINGFVLGSVGTRGNITFTMSYKNGNKKEHRVLNTLHYNIEDSALQTDLDIPSEVYQNVLFSGKIKIKNTGQNSLYDIEINHPGENWTVEKSYCSIDSLGQSSGSWLINEIKPGEEVVIEFTSKPKQNPSEYDFSIQSRLLYNNEKYLQEEIIKQIKIEKLGFNVSLTPQVKSTKAGERMEYSLNYDNQTDKIIKNISFVLKSKDNDFNLDKIELIGNNNICQLDNNIIKIDSLDSNQAGGIKFFADLSRQRQKTNQSIGIKAEVGYLIDGQNPKYEIVSEPVKIISDLKVKSAAYYYSEQGDQLGVGPLPPTVGMATSYWVFWEIDNYGNDLKDFSMTAQLPEGVVWTGNKSLLSGKLLHGEIGGRISWDIEEIKKEGGSYKSGFEVAIAPSLSDAGKAMNLLAEIKYNVQDDFAGSLISGGSENITTNLKYDRLAIGKDKVVQ